MDSYAWVAVATVFLLLLEIVTGRHKGVYQPGDFKLLLGSFMLGRGVMALLAAALVAGIYNLVIPASTGTLDGTSFWLALPLLMLVDEFCFYWVHRWAHEGMGPRKWLGGLWKIHRTHHSGKHMNVMLNFRLNLSWYFIIPAAWVNGLALHLGLAEAVVTNILIKQVWNVVTHSNFRWDDPIRRHRVLGRYFRALEHVLVSPGIHHTHHGYGKDGATYRNFGVVLSLYDWLFGTLKIPEGRPARYGLPGPTAHWLEELFYPLVRIDDRKKVDQH